MTLLLDTPTVAELIRRVGIARFLRELTDRVATDFGRWAQFEKSARVASHSAQGVIELMPTADGQYFSFKYVNGHPGNPARGKLTVGAFGMLADVESGYPVLLSEMTLLTAARTAATSAVAARALARPESRSMALIGTGAQAEFQVLAFAAVLNIRRVHCYDVDERAIEKLQRNLSDVDVEVLRMPSATAAALASDIVTTATADKRRTRVLEAAAIREGHHINAIGGDCPGKTELDPEVVHRCRIVVEYTPQTRVEGELQAVRDKANPVELWEVLTGRKPGRLHPSQVTLFDSVGFAIEDYSTLRYVYELARELDVGHCVTMIPELPDPKDLYSVVRGHADGTVRSHL